MSGFMSSLNSLLNHFLLVMQDFRFIDLIDILVVAYIIYKIVQFVRQTRAKQLIGGVLMLILIWAISEALSMTALSVILRTVASSGIIVIVIIFQPELRSALELVSRSNILFGNRSDSDARSVISDCIDNVCMACDSMQKSKTGALIVFERAIMLEDVAKTGTVIESKANKELICNIFFNKAPLHDGAMIIRSGVIYAAGCILPLTQNNSLSKDLGTRHRASLGMSENSDALVVVVSEETGTISVAERGVLTRDYTPAALREKLTVALLPTDEHSKSKLEQLKDKIFKGGKKSNEKAD